MSWLILFFAGLLEVAWAVGLKVADEKPIAWVAVVLCLIGSVVLLAVAMHKIPLGTAYAVWTGIGVLGTFVVGCIWLHEPVTLMRTVCVLLIAAGIIGLKLTH